jgi:hypothetical protein
LDFPVYRSQFWVAPCAKQENPRKSGLFLYEDEECGDSFAHALVDGCRMLQYFTPCRNELIPSIFDDLNEGVVLRIKVVIEYWLCYSRLLADFTY